MFAPRRGKASINPGGSPQFQTLYIGCMETFRALGQGCTKPLVQRMWDSCPGEKYLPRVVLTLTASGLMMRHMEKQKTPPVIFDIQNISYCSAESGVHDRVFAWICQTKGEGHKDRDRTENKLQCHAVLCSSKEKAQTISLVLSSYTGSSLGQPTRLPPLQSQMRVSDDAYADLFLLLSVSGKADKSCGALSGLDIPLMEVPSQHNLFRAFQIAYRDWKNDKEKKERIKATFNRHLQFGNPVVGLKTHSHLPNGTALVKSNVSTEPSESSDNIIKIKTDRTEEDSLCLDPESTASQDTSTMYEFNFEHKEMIESLNSIPNPTDAGDVGHLDSETMSKMNIVEEEELSFTDNSLAYEAGSQKL